MSPADRSPGSAQRALTEPFVVGLSVSGALVAVIDSAGQRTGVAVSDPVAARWDELELELGVVPLTEAIRLREPQRVADVRSSDINPLLGSGLEQLGVRAIFALPLLLGSATVGVAGLYRTQQGDLSETQVTHALALSRAASMPAIRSALQSANADNDPVDPDDRGGLRREVHQATGMISAQLDITLTEAFARLRAWATTSGRSINALAVDVVDGRVDFAQLRDDT